LKFGRGATNKRRLGTNITEAGVWKSDILSTDLTQFLLKQLPWSLQWKLRYCASKMYKLYVTLADLEGVSRGSEHPSLIKKKKSK
jgi:hypothetical protein